MIPLTWAIAAVVILIAFVLLALRWRKPVGHVSIHMWYDSDIRWERLLAESKRGAEGRQLLVVATHFGETHNAITDAWREAGYTWHTPDTTEQLLEALDNAETGGLFLLDTTHFTASKGMAPVAKSARPIRIIEAELYPTTARSQKLSHVFKAMPENAEMLAFSALDTEVITRAGGDNIKELFIKLNMAKDEPMESPYILAAVQKVQKKNARNAGTEEHTSQPYDNAPAWFAAHDL